MSDPTQAEFTAQEAAHVNSENAFLAAAAISHAMTQAHSGLSSQQKLLEARLYAAVTSSIAGLHSFFEVTAPGVGYTIQAGGNKNPS